jgi:hypothetical protein
VEHGRSVARLSIARVFERVDRGEREAVAAVVDEFDDQTIRSPGTTSRIQAVLL